MESSRITSEITFFQSITEPLSDKPYSVKSFVFRELTFFFPLLSEVSNRSQR